MKSSNNGYESNTEILSRNLMLENWCAWNLDRLMNGIKQISGVIDRNWPLKNIIGKLRAYNRRDQTPSSAQPKHNHGPLDATPLFLVASTLQGPLPELEDQKHTIDYKAVLPTNRYILIWSQMRTMPYKHPSYQETYSCPTRMQHRWKPTRNILLGSVYTPNLDNFCTSAGSNVDMHCSHVPFPSIC